MTFATDPAQLTWQSGTQVRGLGELPVSFG